jgi:thymidylate synthase
MRFDIYGNGFPLITERNMAPKSMTVSIWQKAIGEIFAFINGARTVQELQLFGCDWWEKWGTPEKCQKRGLLPGDLGPGSYGAAFHDFPTAEGTSFNQFAEVLEEIQANPDLRTFFISPWIPQYIPRRPGKVQKVVVAPCHGWLYLRIIDEQLSVVMVQRSADLVLGVPSNMVQYAALTLALGQVIGRYPVEFVHVLLDAHIYESHIAAVQKMLSREPRPFPRVNVDSSVENLFAFRREHFQIERYQPHPGIKGLDVAV